MLVQLGSKKWNVDIEWLSSHISGTFSKKRTFNPSLTIFANWSRERIQGRVIYDLVYETQDGLFWHVTTMGQFFVHFSDHTWKFFMLFFTSCCDRLESINTHTRSRVTLYFKNVTKTFLRYFCPLLRHYVYIKEMKRARLDCYDR